VVVFFPQYAHPPGLPFGSKMCPIVFGICPSSLLLHRSCVANRGLRSQKLCDSFAKLRFLSGSIGQT
jgi:hypothetical protein